ncbi:HAD-IA family hydrolase [Jannaschia sp. W003]|uniref:HAD-IA family hydrolase n=1 Tax=Jannaschia sp. W003 TaxID=2867012 RepID=UPI0021A364C0|nr:HAD-IA family hydrolase [Jannaschia sp. W003]UWQ22941.1 HAD-IA family hydrolase [Jannaschia sp. W003]
MDFDAVIFDLDGTLVDSLPTIRRGFDAVADALGLPRPDRAAAQGFVGGGVPEAMRRMLGWAGADPALHARAVTVMMDRYGEAPPEANRPYDGARETVAALAARMPVGLCTNKPAGPTRALLDALALGPFGAVVCGGDLAERKPHPAPLRETARRLGARRALYVGDSEIDHAAAAAAGMRFAFFEGGYLNAPLGAPEPVLRFGDWAALRASLGV